MPYESLFLSDDIEHLSNFIQKQSFSTLEPFPVLKCVTNVSAHFLVFIGKEDGGAVKVICKGVSRIFILFYFNVKKNYIKSINFLKTFFRVLK